MHCWGGLCRPSKMLFAPALVLLALSLTTSVRADWRVKEVARINSGIIWTLGYIVPFRNVDDTFPMLIYNSDVPYAGINGLYFYRYKPFNRYVLAKIDTANGNRLVPGNFFPWAAEDMNGDGRVEVTGCNADLYPTFWYLVVPFYGRSVRTGVPDSLCFSQRYDSSVIYDSYRFYVSDLDRDGRKEVCFSEPMGMRIMVYEYVPQDSLRLAACLPCTSSCSLGIGDFDSDNQTEFATAKGDWYNYVKVYKCTGNDQYSLWDTVGIQHPNGYDVFADTNFDGLHHAALFASFWSVNGDVQLFQFEPTQGTRGYQAFRVDSTSFATDEVNAHSVCGDIDADGVDEILWSCGSQIQAYRYVAPHQYQRIWYWWNEGSNSANINLYDMNGNGYNEILMSGGNRTIIFEIEAVKTTRPAPHEVIHPGPYSTTWEKYEPPRCDSFSLFYTTDNGRTWLPIVNGLSPNDTSYLWNVPDVRSDSCRVRIFAYGPGWQLDETDSCFSIRPTGVEAGGPSPVYENELTGIDQNPVTGPATVRFQLREAGCVSLRLVDITGRTTRVLADGPCRAGRYEVHLDPTHLPRGVYLLMMQAGDFQQTRKVILSR